MAEFQDSINIWTAASDGNIEIVKSILSSGVSINSQDETGYSPIHAAVSYGHKDLISYLLSNGADIHLKDEDGDTPILVSEVPEIFEYLISQGANPKDANYSNENIFDKAVQDENETMINYLISNSYISNEEMSSIIAKHNIEFKMMEEGDDCNDFIDTNDHEQVMGSTVENTYDNDKKRRKE